MKKVIYITSSSFSGSTLLSFLLNTHPEIFTVGEMNGWNYGENGSFHCSCGEKLADCPFFRTVEEAFFKNKLIFNFRNFGTDYRLSNKPRLNRFITGSLPLGIHSSFLEILRDKLVAHIPIYSHLLGQINKANLVFINTAISFGGASVFVDACKDPYRLRLLHQIPGIKLQAIYLVRDFRGVALSNRKNHGWDIVFSTKMWIKQQLTMLRILKEIPFVHQLYFEDLCDVPNEQLTVIHGFIGLQPYFFNGDYKNTEHHILGNEMRLSGVSKVVKKEKWKKEFSTDEIRVIINIATDFVERNKKHPLSNIIRYYLNF